MFLSFIFTRFLLALQAEHWWDYPGLELWKFVNLGIFVIALVIVMRKFFGVPEILRDRKETIKRELALAQHERDAALAQVKKVEEPLARLDTQIPRLQRRTNTSPSTA